MNRRSALVRLAILAFLLAPPALAQVDISAIEPPVPDQPASWIKLYGHHLFETDIDDEGDVQRQAFIGRLGHRFDMSDDWKLFTQFTYQGNYYDIDDSGPAIDWEDIHQSNLVALLAWKVADHWQLLGGGLVRSSGEGGADFGDTVTAGGALGFLYSSDPKLRVGVLIGVVSSIEDDASVLPLPLLDWKFAEDWLLHLGVVTLDAVGYGAELSWSVSESWELGAGASFERRRFRLDDNGANRDGVAEDTSVPVFARIGFNPNPNIDIDLVGTVSLGGELRVESSSGHQITDRDYDPAAGIGLQTIFRF
jgi:hypothetical protein